MPPLKIAFVAQKLVRGDGQGRAALELVRALVEAGHAVTVCTHDIDADVAEQVQLRRLRRVPAPQFVDDLALLVQATIVTRSLRPDLTIVMGHSALPRRPYVYYAQYSHDAWRRTWTRSVRPGWRHRVHAWLTVPLEVLVARRASAVLAPSSETAAAIAAPSTAPRGVVPNGVDERDARPVDRAAARQHAGVPADVMAIGFVGEYHTGRKGLDVLLAAVAAGPGDEHVVIAGEGDDRWLHREIAALGLEGRVHALGFTSPDRVYDACDLVAVPSRYEPFSLVALEAASVGLPVVLTSTVGAAEHLQGAAVVVAAPPTPEGLRAAFDGLRDVDARRRLGEEGQRLSAALTWPETARRAASFVLSTLV